MEVELNLERQKGSLMQGVKGQNDDSIFLAGSGSRYCDCWGYCVCWEHCVRIVSVSKCNGSESYIPEQCESRECIVYLMILQLKCLHSKKNREFCKEGRLVCIPAGSA